MADSEGMEGDIAENVAEINGETNDEICFHEQEKQNTDLH